MHNDSCGQSKDLQKVMVHEPPSMEGASCFIGQVSLERKRKIGKSGAARLLYLKVLTRCWITTHWRTREVRLDLACIWSPRQTQ